LEKVVIHCLDMILTAMMTMILLVPEFAKACHQYSSKLVDYLLLASTSWCYTLITR